MTNSTLAADFVREITNLIDDAHREAATGRTSSAVRRFDLCRCLVSTGIDQSLLRRHVDNENSKLRKEAEAMKSLVREGSQTGKEGKSALVVADSLGLPRPIEQARFADAIGETYSMQIATSASNRMAVTAHCQRYFTTDDAVTYMSESCRDLSGKNVLIHLGLNDSVTRMFMQEQRIALSLLPIDVSEKILSFVRTYRVHILQNYPTFQYVPLDRFVSNLQTIANLCRTGGASTLTISTIILSPRRFWLKTPEMPIRFGTYNLAIMETAKAVGANVLDIDRLLWEEGILEHLDKDGMHLSASGHKKMAEEFCHMV